MHPESRERARKRETTSDPPEAKPQTPAAVSRQSLVGHPPVVVVLLSRPLRLLPRFQRASLCPLSGLIPRHLLLPCNSAVALGNSQHLISKRRPDLDSHLTHRPSAWPEKPLRCPQHSVPTVCQRKGSILSVLSASLPQSSVAVPVSSFPRPKPTESADLWPHRVSSQTRRDRGHISAPPLVLSTHPCDSPPTEPYPALSLTCKTLADPGWPAAVDTVFPPTPEPLSP